MMIGKDEMGDRMKAYEAATELRLDCSLPICARIDGRSFSSFTRGAEKPFDARVSTAMRETARHLVDQSHARIGYVQSDEITLIWLNEEGGSILFDGRVQKMASVLASMAAVKFFSVYGGNRLPAFDCRVWHVPTKDEAANVILWRAFDARKNSVSSACRALHSARQMHGKRQADMRAMLAAKGVDFDTTYDARDRLGVYFRRVTGERELDDAAWAAIPETHRPASRTVIRSWVDEVPMPFFGDVANRVEVVFDGAEPRERSANKTCM
jgi:tRNA(His) guanylyltransferase